jgi:uncharacterized membrane protein YczE
MLILALGLILNNKSLLGASAISSIAYSTSLIWDLNFSNLMLLLYCVFIAVQLLLLKDKGARIRALLQFPLSLVFTRVTDFYDQVIQIQPDSLPQKLLVLAAAILCTGVGVAMSLDMRIIANPGDGIVDALARFFGKELGLMKNIFDLGSMALTFLLGVVTGHLFCGIGIGTLIGVVGVGRIIALFNHLFKSKLESLAGLD